MKKTRLFALVAASALSVTLNTAFADDNFGKSVVSYSPGTGFAAGYTNPATALGAPSQINPYTEAVDPFNPPYGTGQIVSLGAGGALIIKFDDSVHNRSRNPFGIDFIIFGNSGFIITNEYDLVNYDWIGTPATDGSLFANNTGATRVSVSRDGKKFYELNPAATADGLFPTAGAGDPAVPVNPTLTAADFAGATLADMSAIYHGSAGGTGYDISTARDEKGRRVSISSIKYVRIEVLSGKAEIDALSAVRRSKD